LNGTEAAWRENATCQALRATTENAVETTASIKVKRES